MTPETARANGTARNDSVRGPSGHGDIVPALDDPTRLLVRLSAAIAAGSERTVREALVEAVPVVPGAWVEELILQSYLFAGFPRALNAAREWRRTAGVPAPAADPGARYDDAEHWKRDGEATCAIVYGDFYERLRKNIRALHPALDAWMIVEGYGKVLSRPALDLRRRELCIVAACLAAEQDRQLHSHLHGALNAGAHEDEVQAVLTSVADLVPADAVERARLLFRRVVGHGAR